MALLNVNLLAIISSLSGTKYKQSLGRSIKSFSLLFKKILLLKTQSLIALTQYHLNKYYSNY